MKLKFFLKIEKINKPLATLTKKRQEDSYMEIRSKTEASLLTLQK